MAAMAVTGALPFGRFCSPASQPAVLFHDLYDRGGVWVPGGRGWGQTRGIKAAGEGVYGATR